jgi:hypothetical protein
MVLSFLLQPIPKENYTISTGEYNPIIGFELVDSSVKSLPTRRGNNFNSRKFNDPCPKVSELR